MGGLRPVDDVRYVAARDGLRRALGPRDPAVLQTAVEAALDVLEQTPAEPVLLALAGAATSNDALLDAARRLDAPLADETLVGTERAGAVVDSARAAAIAERAQPGPPQTISLCMIVKDEEAQLDRALSSIAPAVDEIVVVDTGSSDRTPEIARAYGARLVDHPWSDHFAEARNAGLDNATSDWITFIDADEALVPDDRELLRDLTRATWREGYSFLRRNRPAEGAPPTTTNRTFRLWRNRPEYRFTGRIHEDISSSMPPDAPERVGAAGVRLEHYGYGARTRASLDKSRRNLELLERQAAEEPPAAHIEYYLGSEYAALGDHARAVEHFDRAATLLGDEPRPFARTLFRRHIVSLRMIGRLADAQRVAERATTKLPDFTDLWFEWAQVARAAGDLEQAEHLARKALDLADAPEHYGGMVGAGSFKAAGVLAATLAERGELEEAERLLRDTLAAHPHHTDAVSPLAGAMLARGATPQEIEGALRAATPLTPQLRAALAQALREAGQTEAAHAQFAAIEGEAPNTDAAHLARAERALDAGEWSAAHDAAAQVDPEGEHAGEAAAAQAAAQLMSRDAQPASADALDAAAPAVDAAHRASTEALAAAAAAVEAARTSGAGDDTVAFLRAWLAAATGDEPPPIPDSALPPLILAFERALNAGEIDRAVELLRLFDHVRDLPPRTRRELLALIYLRHGMLDSAADEWGAAAQESGPDSAAMLGLARVAAARGDADDALVFAEGALELDPTSVAAQQVVAALRGES